jgi:hypothetical protein
MQTMQYMLAELPLSINSGLRQDSRASPPAFMALSSLIVNVYRHMGHGTWIYLSYFHLLLILARVMYVNDMDLLHWPHHHVQTLKS